MCKCTPGRGSSPHGREAVEHPCDRQMTFQDHLGSSWPSAEAQRVRQSSKSHMAAWRNRWYPLQVSARLTRDPLKAVVVVECPNVNSESQR
eukprot:scaffold47224_cov39-Phaeocystis_antarctica.AAC.1